MTRPFRNRWIAGAITAVLLGGCSHTPPQKRPAPDINLSGFPPAYKHGYADGCATARHFGETKDEKRYNADVQYAQGWNDGKSLCAR